jgi:hypothetical protein
MFVNATADPPRATAPAVIAVIAVIAVMTNLLATSVVKMGIETTELFSVWLFSDWGAAASRVPVRRTPDSN